MTDDTHHMRLVTLLIEGVAHGLAIDGQTFILARVEFVPAAQGAVQMRGVDADQNIADDELAGYDVTAFFATAPETLPGLLAETFWPNRRSPGSRAYHTRRPR